MNDRIKELAEQAIIPFKDENLFECHHFSKEKFAELIIQKCAMIGNYAYDGGEYPGKMIKEYFGVE
jgi:hypothetical protein